jgi:hypothetical protein
MDEQIVISKHKQSLEYIPSPCLKSHKLKIVRKNMGRVAELMYIDLLKFIGSQKHSGYWLYWNNDAKDIFMFEYDYTAQELEQYLSYFFERDFFSKAMLDKYNILTEEEIQQVWLLCAKKRMRFIEGTIRSYMLVSFEKEIQENQKRFSRFNKLVEIKSEFDENFQSKALSHSTSTPQEYLHEFLTSAHIQHKHKAVSKSEAISNSNKHNIIHPTDVDKTCKKNSSTGSILNSFNSESLLDGFEPEKNISNSSNKTNKKSSPAKFRNADTAQIAKVKLGKSPHSVREDIIFIWGKGNNMAIPPLIRKFETFVKKDVNSASVGISQSG